MAAERTNVGLTAYNNTNEQGRMFWWIQRREHPDPAGVHLYQNDKRGAAT
jgi:hypothetical protein